MYQYQLSFSEAVQIVLSKYCNFSGRASRSEYWWWAVFQFIIGIIAGIIGMAMFGIDSVGYNVLTGLVSLVFLLPGLGVAVRRMHDIGKGGGWIFISLIPIVGVIWFIVLTCQASQPEENRFGPVPYLRPIGQ